MADCTCTNFPASLGNVTFGASVGIGTTSPASTLDVAGSGGTVAAYVGPTSDDYGALVLRGGTANTYWEFVKLRAGDTPADGLYMGFVNGATSTPVLVATPGGSVGIGTASPQQKLDVAGTVRTTGILLGGDMLLSGGIKDSTGQYTRVDYQGCYYTS